MNTVSPRISIRVLKSRKNYEFKYLKRILYLIKKKKKKNGLFMKRIFFKKTLAAGTFGQITKDFSSRLQLFVKELLVNFGPITAANIAVNEKNGIQIGCESRAAIGVIDTDTPIVLTSAEVITVIGTVSNTIHFVPKDSIKIQLNDDGQLFIGVISHDVGQVSGWISFTTHEPNNPKKYLR